MNCNHSFEFLQPWNVLVCTKCAMHSKVNYIEEFDETLDYMQDDSFISWLEADEEDDGVVWNMELRL